MSFIEYSIHYQEMNFWDANPQLKYIKPFSDLYNNDSSNNKEFSSKDMWCVFFMSDPDEENNKFFRIPYIERYEMLKETFNITFDLDNELIKECMKQYPLLCLTSVQRALKDEKEVLMKRADFLKSQDYTLDTYEMITGAGGRLMRVTLPGTAKQLDTMHKSTKAIMDNFAKIEADFLAEKVKSQLKGNRQESKSERGEI